MSHLGHHTTGTASTEVSARIYLYFCLFDVAYLLSPLCSQIVYYCVDGKCECFHSNYEIISYF